MIRAESPAAAGTPQPKQIWTGTLRTDIRFFPPGEHGNYPLLYDPLSEHYYKMTDRSCRILRMLDRNYPMEEFLAKVNQAGIDADQEEISALNNLTEQYLVFAQGQAMRRIPMHMSEWAAKLDAFITLNGRSILTDAGKISHELAVQRAEAEYDLFDHERIAAEAKQPSDFDKFVAAVPLLRPRKKKQGVVTNETQRLLCFHSRLDLQKK